jgi:DNA-binding transcriptional MerR regulator
MNDLLTVKELAEKAGVTERTIRDYLRDNDIEPDDFIRREDSKKPVGVYQVEIVFQLKHHLTEQQALALKTGEKIVSESQTEEGRAKLEVMFTAARLVAGDITKEQFNKKIEADPLVAQLSSAHAKLLVEHKELIAEKDDLVIANERLIEENSELDGECESLAGRLAAKINKERKRMKPVNLQEMYDRGYFN